MLWFVRWRDCNFTVGGPVSISGNGTNEASFTLGSDLSVNTAYYVHVESNAFKDGSNNYFTGFTDQTTWNFTTAPSDAPVVASFSPADDAHWRSCCY